MRASCRAAATDAAPWPREAAGWQRGDMRGRRCCCNRSANLEEKRPLRSPLGDWMLELTQDLCRITRCFRAETSFHSHSSSRFATCGWLSSTGHKCLRLCRAAPNPSGAGVEPHHLLVLHSRHSAVLDPVHVLRGLIDHAVAETRTCTSHHGRLFSLVTV